MTDKLDAEERARVEAEETAGEKLLELDALKCVAAAALPRTRPRECPLASAPWRAPARALRRQRHTHPRLLF